MTDTVTRMKLMARAENSVARRLKGADMLDHLPDTLSAELNLLGVRTTGNNNIAAGNNNIAVGNNNSCR